MHGASNGIQVTDLMTYRTGNLAILRKPVVVYHGQLHALEHGYLDRQQQQRGEPGWRSALQQGHDDTLPAGF